jgi:hypothetical protein
MRATDRFLRMAVFGRPHGGLLQLRVIPLYSSNNKIRLLKPLLVSSNPNRSFHI